MVRQVLTLFLLFFAIFIFSSTLATAGNESESANKTIAREILEEVRVLRNRTQELEDRLMDLESKAVLSEPELIVKQKDIWVCDDGQEFDRPDRAKCRDGKELRKSFTYQREKVYRRQTISEKIEEALTAEEGISMGVSATATVQQAIGIGSHENKAEGDLFGIGSVDLLLIGKPALNTMFFVDIEAIGGFSPDTTISNISVLNSDNARRTNDRELNIREAWMKLELFEQQLSLYGGMLDLTNYFDANRVANDEDSQFITDTLVNNPLLGAPANGGGITAIYDPKTGVNFRWGIQRSDSASTGLTEEVFSVIEIGYLSHFITIPEGHYRVWYRFDKDLGKENMAYGFSIDQKLSASLTLFGRFGHKFTSDQFQDDDFFYSGGFQFKNRYTFSPGDYWAFGYQHTDLGTEIKESLIEGYYNFDLAESFKASFHLQYLFDSNSGGADKSYLLPGLRVHFDF
ncbi:MAG: hypothetical protein HOF21_00890 [Nitrospina sp.]|nr:hypothetical protein [Nitrospina sp.]MBT5633058.1 hypothetical protein [Nitrospina sp.]